MTPTVGLLILALAGAQALPRGLGKRSLEYVSAMRSMRSFDPMHNECGFELEERTSCGKVTYDEEECKIRGCCYDQCPGCAAEVPWCFLAKRMLREECSVDYEMKDDCGYYGITEGECFMRDCCWMPSALPNEPSCFYSQSVRLADGETREGFLSGRVEINHDGQWGTICDDNFYQEAAAVVCRSLGFENSQYQNYAYFGEGEESSPIWMDGMSCSGDEEKIEECPFNGWGSHDCRHYEDAGVECWNDNAVIDTDTTWTTDTEYTWPTYTTDTWPTYYSTDDYGSSTYDSSSWPSYSGSYYGSNYGSYSSNSYDWYDYYRDVKRAAPTKKGQKAKRAMAKMAHAKKAKKALGKMTQSKKPPAHIKKSLGMKQAKGMPLRKLRQAKKSMHKATKE